jgi:hypothetical protein
LDFRDYESLDVYPSNFLYKLAGYFITLNISVHLVNYIFSIISFIPFIFFLKIIEKLKIFKYSKIDYFLVIFFLFLPSFHFWISGFSKDTISFVAIFFISYLYLVKEDLELPKTSNTLSIVLILFLMILLYFVRPHLALLMFVTAVIYYLFRSKYSSLNFKFILNLILIFLISYFLLISVFSKKLSYQHIYNTIIFFNNLKIIGATSQISVEVNLLVKFIYYLFFPNIFFTNYINFWNTIVAIENTFLFFFFIKLFQFNLRFNKFLIFNLTMVIIFFFSMTIITSNLGIANRQKWMVLLPLIIFFLYKKFYAKNLKFSK